MKRKLFFLAQTIVLTGCLIGGLSARPEEKPKDYNHEEAKAPVAPGPSGATTQAPREEIPIIPPTISKIWPVGIQRGATTTFRLEGRNLAGLQSVLFDTSGLSAKIVDVNEIPEKARVLRVGVDLAAQVPEGKKSEAKLEVTASPDVEPGIHWLRVRTPLGTSNTSTLDVGSFPEIEAKASDASASEQTINLPATVAGIIAQPGEVHDFDFNGKLGEEVVFEVVGSEVGSKLLSLLVLRGPDGQALARSGESSRSPDAVLNYKLPAEGKYTISVSDRERGGGMDHFYRLKAGAIPYVTEVFPLGVRAAQPAEVTIKGVNLGDIHQVSAQPPKWADGWTIIPLQVKTPQGQSLNKVSLAVGNEPETLEKEPNNSPSEAQPVTLPATVNGHIYGEERGGPADQDYFRFAAKKGQKISIDVAASRLGSPLDSLIEVLDTQGSPIPRATVRCLNQTSLTLFDRGSVGRGYRVVSFSGLHENDYLMVGDELNQIDFIPDQPDADIMLKGFGKERFALLGTSPEVHYLTEPIYRVEVLPPGAEFPPNGLPVFHLTYRNDDGGPGYGSDSHLDFTAPEDGDYLVRIRDTRGLQGENYAYRLTLRMPDPDFELTASTENPNVPRGGRVPITVTANRTFGYEGPIGLEVRGLPKGITAKPATIPAGQDSTVVILEAAANAPQDTGTAPGFEIVGKGHVDGRTLVRIADARQPLRVASLMPPPDLVVATEPKDIVLEPGKSATVTLQVRRMNGFQWRVPCAVMNLPPGVRVVNLGLNGVLVPENETTRTFTLLAERWAKPVEQPIYVVATAESNSPTLHASLPINVRVVTREMASSARERGKQQEAASAIK